MLRTGSGYAAKVRDMYCRVACCAAIYDGHVPSEKQLILDEVKAGLAKVHDADCRPIRGLITTLSLKLSSKLETPMSSPSYPELIANFPASSRLHHWQAGEGSAARSPTEPGATSFNGWVLPAAGTRYHPVARAD